MLNFLLFKYQEDIMKKLYVMHMCSVFVDNFSWSNYLLH